MEARWKRDGNIVSGFSPDLTDLFIRDRPTPSKTVHDSSDQYSEVLLEKLETRRAKALLQPILQAVHVYLEGRLEVEFRG